MPDDTTRKPDAIKTPAGWAPGDSNQKLLFHKVKLGPIFNAGAPPTNHLVWVRNQGNRFNFCTTDPGQELYFPSTHSLAGQERYRWEPAPESLGLGPGVEFGFLLPDPDAAS